MALIKAARSGAGTRTEGEAAVSTALPPTEVASQLKLRTLYPVYFRKSIPFSSIRFNQIPFSVPEPVLWPRTSIKEILEELP